MKVAIMQPYVFPYLGYFQLIDAVDTFVFYDDVHFIKGGWINRNRILVQKKESLFTIPLIKASQNKLIHEIEVDFNSKIKNKFFTTIEQNYRKAPYFDDVFGMLEHVLTCDYHSIAHLAERSVKMICNYLSAETKFQKSSQRYSDSRGEDKTERIISICKKLKASEYINPIGGKAIYKKEDFKKEGINLLFVENELKPYIQFGNNFVSGLSIIDVLMFNSKTETKRLIGNYNLI